jgi:hypothetical protein
MGCGSGVRTAPAPVKQPGASAAGHTGEPATQNTPSVQEENADPSLPHEELATEDTQSVQYQGAESSHGSEEDPAAKQEQDDDDNASPVGSGAESTPYATPDTGGAGDRDGKMPDASMPKSEED